MRTLAIVAFKEPVHNSLQQAHKNIIQGQSIGIALREDGWKVEKRALYFGSVSLSPQLQTWMQEHESNCAAVHIYELSVFKENPEELIPYCAIIEVHSPQYLDESWLQSLYPDQYEAYRKNTSEISQIMYTLESLIKDFPYPSITADLKK